MVSICLGKSNLARQTYCALSMEISLSLLKIRAKMDMLNESGRITFTMNEYSNIL